MTRWRPALSRPPPRKQRTNRTLPIAGKTQQGDTEKTKANFASEAQSEMGRPGSPSQLSRRLGGDSLFNGRRGGDSLDAALVVALQEAGEGVKKRLRAIERIHVQLGVIVSRLVIGIENHGGDAPALPFRADTPAVIDGNRVGDHDGADVTRAQDLNGRLNSSYRYNTVSRVGQNGIADRSQHSFR
jgi:hypothetical protein